VIAARSLAGSTVAVFGLAGSGLATARSLVAGGARIVAWDDNPDKVAAAAAEGLSTGDLRFSDWRGFAALALSPGVPLTHPKPHWVVELARASRVPVIGDIEIFARERRGIDAPFIAITGTNGKSTTTALTAHLLAHAGRDAQMGGNIGRPVLTLDPPQAGRHYVVECSSYQVDLSPSLAPDIGILLNVTPDHLDRHGTLANYAAVKERLVAGSRHAIVAVDDPLCSAIAERLKRAGRNVITISKDTRLADGYFAAGPELMRAEGGEARPVASLSGIGSLRGVHNAQNALAALAACTLAGLSPAEIGAGLASFAGLAHRMEQVGRRDGVLFVNDSKATNADAAALALSSFDRIYWIAGGLAKDGGFDVLRPHFGRIAKAYLIGDAAAALAAALGDEVTFEISGTLDVAVAHAARDAAYNGQRESVVLLSPACASFDQFRNFEVRGDTFRSAVLALSGVADMKGGN
jgi:UDP-N-acetylmuramoylalanine--D-glutamate ligase